MTTSVKPPCFVIIIIRRSVLVQNLVAGRRYSRYCDLPLTRGFHLTKHQRNDLLGPSLLYIWQQNTSYMMYIPNDISKKRMILLGGKNPSAVYFFVSLKYAEALLWGWTHGEFLYLQDFVTSLPLTLFIHQLNNLKSLLPVVRVLLF